MAIVVRRAVAADADAAAAVLADAFADYPWTRWTIDADAHGQRVEDLQRLCLNRLALPYGEVWLACDEADAVLSVAVWTLPQSAPPPAELDEMGEVQATLEGDRHEASVAAEAFVAPLRPATPHYYLGAVGTRRDRQRQGLATAVLTPILERADRGGEPAFLETSAPDNVSFYERLGFVVVTETAVPDGGPYVWTMLRP